jgi:hypothetical protein
MINEIWYYFNKDEKDLKEYIRKILCYPHNYTTLVEFRDYMKNYKVFFSEDYRHRKDLQWIFAVGMEYDCLRNKKKKGVKTFQTFLDEYIGNYKPNYDILKNIYNC